MKKPIILGYIGHASHGTTLHQAIRSVLGTETDVVMVSGDKDNIGGFPKSSHPHYDYGRFEALLVTIQPEMTMLPHKDYYLILNQESDNEIREKKAGQRIKTNVANSRYKAKQIPFKNQLKRTPCYRKY